MDIFGLFFHLDCLEILQATGFLTSSEPLRIFQNSNTAEILISKIESEKVCLWVNNVCGANKIVVRFFQLLYLSFQK